jgi:rod shape determining protein RodA
LGLLIILLNYRLLLNSAGVLYGGLLLLLVVTFVIGIETRGSTRWIDLGLATLQPSELAKPILVLTLTAFFLKFPPHKIRSLFFSLLIVLLPTLLVFAQPDLGSALILGLIWFGLVYLAGVKLKYFLGLIVLGLVALPLGFNLLKDYQKERLLSFLNPEADPLGTGYNLVQSIIAVGSGQLLGRGFGRGTQSHLNFLPEQKTDFIFATTAEELGFVGVVIILILFSILIYRLLVIARESESKGGALLCYGAVLVIASQLFVNAGMNMGLLPITGITLPFVSFGGSSLISMIALVALAQSVHLNKKLGSSGLGQ